MLFTLKVQWEQLTLPMIAEGSSTTISKGSAIPQMSSDLPDNLDCNPTDCRRNVGKGFVENVPPAVWTYAVSGKPVLKQRFSYRRKTRERLQIGDRRKASPLGDIQPDHWLPEYTNELINVLNVLAMLVELEPRQADLLARSAMAR